MRTVFRKISLELVRAHPALALAAIYERIVKRRFMARVLPNQSIENDRRVDTLDVIALVNEPAPPGLLDVVAELDAEWTIIPGAAQTAIDLRRRKNKTSPLGERNDGVDVWCRHEYIKPQRSTKSTIGS
jgi:hypothetical protein